jgi:Fic family protein
MPVSVANHKVILYGSWMNFESLTHKKTLLDQYRPLPPALVRNLAQWFLIELTYTSNAIEGNTLTRKETAVVVEKGLTVGGKSLVEHLEATNHAKALQRIMDIVAAQTQTLNEHTILDIHHTILHGIDDNHAGHYRSIPVRISGSQVVLPNPQKVPDLMAAFLSELTTASDVHPVQLAADAHYQLVTIHPFVDGNGRTARLLMNLILMQQGYPPALIRKRDRLRYISSLEKAQLGGSKDDYYKIISKAVDRSLDIYLKALTVDQEEVEALPPTLLRIGQLAKLSQESTDTLRFWTKEGLLQVADTTEANYQLYSPEMVGKIAKIRELQGQRYTLKEIKASFDS